MCASFAINHHVLRRSPIIAKLYYNEPWNDRYELEMSMCVVNFQCLAMLTKNKKQNTIVCNVFSELLRSPFN